MSKDIHPYYTTLVGQNDVQFQDTFQHQKPKQNCQYPEEIITFMSIETDKPHYLLIILLLLTVYGIYALYESVARI